MAGYLHANFLSALMLILSEDLRRGISVIIEVSGIQNSAEDSRYGNNLSCYCSA